MPVRKKPILKKYNPNYHSKHHEFFCHHDTAANSAKVQPATNNDAIEE
jgi:hypothetical protein